MNRARFGKVFTRQRVHRIPYSYRTLLILILASLASSRESLVCLVFFFFPLSEASRKIESRPADVDRSGNKHACSSSGNYCINHPPAGGRTATRVHLIVGTPVKREQPIKWWQPWLEVAARRPACGETSRHLRLMHERSTPRIHPSCNNGVHLASFERELRAQVHAERIFSDARPGDAAKSRRLGSTALPRSRNL